MSEIDKLQRIVNFKLDELLDDFEGQFDLIDFNEEKFIPIEYNLELLHFLNCENLEDNYLEICFVEKSLSKSIKSILSKDDFDLKFNKINESCETHIKYNGLSNTYISVGLVKYDDLIGPSILIPIFIEKYQNSYRIFRNYNQEVQFNGLFKFILNEENIEMPDFDGSLNSFINEVSKLEDITYHEVAFVGNFDLKFQQLFYDLNVNNWHSIEEKLDLFTSNNVLMINNNLNLLKDNLDKSAKDLSITDDVLFSKALLSKNNSVLIIADDLMRDKIKNSFKNDNFEGLLLELSETLDITDFYKNILNSERMLDEDILELDKLVRTRDKYSKIIELINTKYSRMNLSAKEIKLRKDDFTKQLKDRNLSNFIFEINDVMNYNELDYKNLEEEINEILLIDEDLFTLQDYFSLEYFKSNEFKNLIRISKSIGRHLNYLSKFNQELNEDYGVKIFEDLFSIGQLSNISVLDKNPILIAKEDIESLNTYLKNYFVNKESPENENLNKYFELDDDFIESIDINLKYSELIYNEIISPQSHELISDDFENAIVSSDYFVDVSYFILKELQVIIDFYNDYPVFKVDEELLKMDGNIVDIKKLISIFKNHVEDLIEFKRVYGQFNSFNENIKKFIKFIYESEVKQEDFSFIFWFNIYNSLLNNFLNYNDFIEEDKINSEYDLEYKKIDNDRDYDDKQLLLQHMYSKPIELNKSAKAINQKNDLNNKYQIHSFDSIKNILHDYKEYITANNRIFMMDLGLVSQLLDETYENYFDYVIVTEDFEHELDKLSLLLRSKNKIIQIGCENV